MKAIFFKRGGMECKLRDVFVLLLVAMNLVYRLPHFGVGVTANAQGMLHWACNGRDWLDGDYAVATLSAGGIAAVVSLLIGFLGGFSVEELSTKRNGASVLAACLLAVWACIFFVYFFLPCQSAWEVDGSMARIWPVLMTSFKSNFLVFSVFVSMLLALATCTGSQAIRLLLEKARPST